MEAADRSFSKALKWLKRGELVQREGWNGKRGDYLYLVDECDPDAVPTALKPWTATSSAVLPFGGMQAFIMRKSGPGIAPWTADQADLLAEDWLVVSAAHVTREVYDE